MSGSKLSDVSFDAAATQAPPPADEALLGLTVHILVAGATFNLHTRKASAGSLARAKSE